MLSVPRTDESCLPEAGGSGTTMRGRKKTHVIELQEPTGVQLRQIVASRTRAYSEVQRAQIILLCGVHPDWTDTQVAAALACSPSMVWKWRKRWRETRSLQEAPRSGRPRRLPPG